jgi:hypothetical protein
MVVRVQKEQAMTAEMICPWCATELVLRDDDQEQTCVECLTTWSYEDESETQLLLAA